MFVRDVLCGMLQCSHRNERLVFWKEALSYLMPEAWIMVNGTRQDCKGAILDVGLNMPDPGMTPEGTKCGTEKVGVTLQRAAQRNKHVNATQRQCKVQGTFNIRKIYLTQGNVSTLGLGVVLAILGYIPMTLLTHAQRCVCTVRNSYLGAVV